jgi:predicted nucleotidyltransferase
MIQKYSRYRILVEFFKSPRKNFQMREISRRTKITQPTVINHLRALVKEGLILKEKRSIYPSFIANRESSLFKIYKKDYILFELQKSGFIDYIYDSCVPDCIILFGSASKGEDIEESDIDIFVQSKSKKLDLKKYEKQFNRSISLFFEGNFIKLSNELKNNIINGVIINGYLKVF